MGNIVVFEGVDGCGKSSIVAKTAELLKQQGYNVKTAREIGGTPIGEKIRKLILFPEPEHELSAISETLLIYAARERLLATIREDSKTIYLLDRHYISTHIYQGSDPAALELSLMLAEQLTDHKDYLCTVLVERDNAGRGVVADAMEDKYCSDVGDMQERYIDYVTKLSSKWFILQNNSTLENAALTVIDHLEWYVDQDISVFKSESK